MFHEKYCWVLSNIKILKALPEKSSTRLLLVSVLEKSPISSAEIDSTWKRNEDLENWKEILLLKNSYIHIV